MTRFRLLRDALVEEDWLLALDLGLSVWRQTRHPGLVPALLYASERAQVRYDGPRARTRVAFDRRWCEVAETDPSPVATGWLADNLTYRVPELDPRDGDYQRRGFASERHAALLRRVALLSARTPDPRVARAGLAVVRPGRLGAFDEAQTRDLYTPILRLIEAAGDPGAADEVLRLAGRPPSRRATVRAVLVEDLPATAEVLRRISWDPELDLSVLNGVIPAPGRPRRAVRPEIEGLLARVYEEPDDPEVRAVLCDAWLEADGPQADLVRLQRRGTPPDDHQIRSIVRRHAANLMGEVLSRVLVRPSFRDGLVETATVRATQAASTDAWDRAPHAPELGTIRVLRRGHASAVRYASLVLSPLAGALRRIDVEGPRFLEEVIQGPERQLEGIRLGCVDCDPCAHLLAAPELSSVFAVDVPYLDLRFVDEFVKQGIAGRIREFGVAAGNAYYGYRGTPAFGKLGRVRELLPNLERFVVAYDGDLPMLAYARDDDGWAVEIRLPRSPDRYYFVDHGSLFWLDPDRPSLWSLPESIRRVRLVGYAPEEVREALEHRWSVEVRRVAA